MVPIKSSAPPNTTSRGLSHREELLIVLLTGGTQSRSAAERVISLAVAEAMAESNTELDRLRAELAALPAPVVETGFRDTDGQVWPTTGIPPRTVELVLRANPLLQRTVRTSEWTEVTA